MPDNREEPGQPAPDYSRGYYDREGRWVEYRDIGKQYRNLGRHGFHRGPATQGVIFAVVLIAVGVLLFLDNIGLFRFRDIWQFWPVLPIALGVAKLFDSKGIAGQVWAAMWILVGAAFLFDHLGIWHMNWGTIWPLAIVAFGVTTLVNALDRHQRRSGRVRSPAPAKGQLPTKLCVNGRPSAASSAASIRRTSRAARWSRFSAASKSTCAAP